MVLAVEIGTDVTVGFARHRVGGHREMESDVHLLDRGLAVRVELYVPRGEREVPVDHCGRGEAREDSVARLGAAVV